jgi:hypothetical protein
MRAYDRLTAFCRTRWVYSLFFVLPLFVYYPLFRSGMVLQGGTDLYFGHYPDLLYGHHMLRQGDLGLWNRLIYDGTDFSYSLLNHILYPLNWLTLAVPDADVLHFISWQLFLEICASGCLAYAIAGLLLEDPWARLLVAITVQLGGFMWFNVTTFIGVHLTFVALIAVFFLLTPERRRPLVNFLALSFSFAGVTLIGHPGYLTGFGLVLIGVFLAKICTLASWRDRGAYGVSVVAAGLAGLALGAFRIVPIFTELSQQSVSVASNWLPNSNAYGVYYLIAGVIPGMFGLNTSEAAAIGNFLGVPGHNNQFHVQHYFGIIAFFLLYLAMFAKAGRQALVTAWIALFLMAAFFVVHPFSDAFYLVFWPVIHEAMPKYTSYFAIFAMMAFVLRALETGRVRLDDEGIKGFLLIIAAVLVTFITFLANVVHNVSLPPWERFSVPHWERYAVALKLLLLCMLGIGVGIAARQSLSAVLFGRLTAFAVLLFAALGAATGYGAWRHPDFFGQFMAAKNFASDWGAVAWCLAIISLARLVGGTQPPSPRDRVIFWLAGGFALLLLFAPVPEGHPQRDYGQAPFTALWSAGVFLVAACAVTELFAGLVIERIDRRHLMFLLAALTIGDLLFFNRVYQYVNGPPFVAVTQMYPEPRQWERRADALDLAQYRVAHPAYLVGLGNEASNFSVVYGIPTYGGEDSDVPADYLSFLSAFDPNLQRWYTRAGIITEIRNDRLLDLLGVRYDVASDYAVQSRDGVTLRPNALARFSLLKHFEIVPERNAALARLKNPAFDPTTTVVLDHDPGWKPAVGVPERFLPMPYREVRSDLIRLSYDEASPSVLLFDDTYSPSWHAELDGAALNVYRGNVNFMAVSLPAGRHTLTLSFEPVQFYKLARISLATALLLLALAGYVAGTAVLRRLHHARRRAAQASAAMAPSQEP